MMIWLMIGYMILFIDRPFEVWTWLGDLRIELVYMLLTGAVWVFYPRKRLAFNSLNLAYCGFATVVLLACAASPWSEKCLTFYLDMYWKFLVFYLLLVTAVDNEKDLKRVVVGLVAALSVYMLHSFREFLVGRHVTRMGINRMIGTDFASDPNAFASTIILGLVFVPTLWRTYPDKRARALLVGYTCLSFMCIILTGSRGGFLALILWASVSISQSRWRWQLGFAAIALSPLMWMVMGEPLQKRFETILWPEVGPKNAQQSTEGRIEGFLIGMQLWQDNPLLGIGPSAWRPATHRPIESHNLYGQLVGETGTLGLLAFLGVLSAYWVNLRAVRKMCRPAAGHPPDFLFDLTTAIGTAVLLLLFSGTYAHNLFRVQWLWYAGFLVAARACAEQRMSTIEPAPLQFGHEKGDLSLAFDSHSFPSERKEVPEYA